MYFLRGGTSSLHNSQLEEPPPPLSTLRLFKFFQMVVRDLIRTNFVESDRPLFEAPLNPQRRLASLGFNQSTPKLKFLLVLNESERHHLGIQRLKLRPKFTNAMQALFESGELRLEPAPFRLKCAFATPTALRPLALSPWVTCVLSCLAPSSPSPGEHCTC